MILKSAVFPGGSGCSLVTVSQVVCTEVWVSPSALTVVNTGAQGIVVGICNSNAGGRSGWAEAGGSQALAGHPG